MKNLFLFIVSASVVLYSCKNNDTQSESNTEDSLSSAPFFWQAYLDDSTGKLELRKIPANDSLSPQSVINYMNDANTNIKLELVRLSGDTIFIRIPEAMYLTQQMGSTGPTLYLSEVVYNLTQIKGINEVNIEFEQGDHASPGIYNRSSFDQN